MRWAIELRGVTHAFGTGDTRRQVLDAIDLMVAPGEIVFLMGPSGCGKTTVLTLIGALRSVQEGSVRVLGRELAGADRSTMIAIRRRIGFVFQHHHLHRSLDALGNVRMALEARGQAADPDAEARCLRALATVGLADYARRYPEKLSGGQKQRVAIARALVGAPQLVLADEPTAALDSRNGRDAMELMRRIASDEGASVLMATHDPRVQDLADRIVTMEDGRIIATAG